MIKINLLDTYYLNKKAIKLEIALCSVSLILLISFLHSIYQEYVNANNLLQSEHSLLKKDLEILNQKTKPLKELKAKEASLQNRLDLITNIQTSKVASTSIFNDIKFALPKKVWLLALQKNEDTLEIQGRALKDADIMSFIKNLEKSSYLSNVELKISDLIFYNQKTKTFQKNIDLKSKDTQQADNQNWHVKAVYNYVGTSKKQIEETDNIPLKEFFLTSKIVLNPSQEQEQAIAGATK